MRGALLAFDTATSVATSALVLDGEVVGERVSGPAEFLAKVDGLLEEAGLEPDALAGLVVGTGPGSFTGVRIGLAGAKGMALALGVPVAGVSTLAALAAGAPGAVPVVDAKRREVFALVGGEPRSLRPEELAPEPGTTCVGDGAVRYRAAFEAAGARVPPDESALHVPRAKFHAGLATEFRPADEVAPIYVRLPDAERTRRQW